MTDDPFVAHRSLLFTVGYEMLGSAADAEDAVQETWLRWADVDQAEVRDPRAYLVRIVTRVALNRLRAVARQREQYVGEWLPEPLLTSPRLAAAVRRRAAGPALELMQQQLALLPELRSGSAPAPVCHR
jgi:RNA polymerase sigma-70 factor (ECF subfamily)